MEERKVIRELLDSKQYTRLRQMLSELNDADIAALLEEMEEQDMLKVFRILPKDLAADVFSYMDCLLYTSVRRDWNSITEITPFILWEPMTGKRGAS